MARLEKAMQCVNGKFEVKKADRSGDNCCKKSWIVTHRAQKEGAHHIIGGRTGSSGSVRRQRERGGNEGKSLYCGFCGKEHARQGKQAYDCLV